MADRDDERSQSTGFRLIGGLMSKTLDTLAAKVTTENGQSERPTSTAITISPRERSSQTGTRAGERGSVTQTSSKSVEELLAGADPEATDKAILRSLPPSVASILRPIEREFIHPVYGYDVEVTGYRLIDEPSDRDRRAAEAMLYDWSRPAAPAVIQAELARLRSATKARAELEGDLRMVFQVLADECGEWPADVVRAALRRWARRERWFPSLAEIRDELQRVGRNRQLIEEVLRDPRAAERRQLRERMMAEDDAYSAAERRQGEAP